MTVAPNPTPLASMADYSIPGMRIQPGGPGDAWTLLVRTAARRTDWILEPQDAVERISTLGTPTTIRYRGRLYRIYEETAAETGWIYRMYDCPDGETTLQVIELDRAIIARAAAERKEFVKVQTMARTSAKYEILLGWLPADWQIGLSNRLHFSPEDATRKNGVVMIMLGIGFAALDLSQSNIMGAFSMFLLAVDGVTRWISGLIAEQPLGILPLEGLDRLVRFVVRTLGQLFRNRQATATTPGPTEASPK